MHKRLPYHLIAQFCVPALFILTGIGMPARTSATLIPVTDLGTISGGNVGDAYYPAAISSMGKVAGRVERVDGTIHAFLWTPTTPNATTGTMQDLGVLTGGVESEATGVNDSGQVTGTSYVLINGVQVPHAFSWSGGTMTDLGTLNSNAGDNSGGAAINNAGQIVGSSQNGSQVFQIARYIVPLDYLWKWDRW